MSKRAKLQTDAIRAAARVEINGVVARDIDRDGIIAHINRGANVVVRMRDEGNGLVVEVRTL